MFSAWNVHLIVTTDNVLQTKELPLLLLSIINIFIDLRRNSVFFQFCKRGVEKLFSLFSNSQSFYHKIVTYSWHQKLHCLYHKSVPKVPNLSQINPVHILIPSSLFQVVYPIQVFKLHFRNHLSLLHTLRISYPFHSQFDHYNNIWSDVQIMKLFIIQISPSPFYFRFFGTVASIHSDCFYQLLIALIIKWPLHEQISFRDQIDSKYK